jgi:lactate dehydrogenase-like 2-hydroxyacid dehydrogenase
VLLVGPLPTELVAEATERYDTRRLPEDPLTALSFLASTGGDFRAVITSGRSRVSASLIEVLTGLEVIVNYGVGYDHLDLEAAAQHGVVVSNTPDVLTQCVADAAVGATIDVLRSLSAGDRFVRAGRWAAGETFSLSRRVTGRRIGILGLGRIGSAIAQRFEGFECTISYHSRSPVAEVDYAYASSPGALADGAEVLVISTPGGSDTAAIVDRDVINRLGPEGVIVNVARGSVIDQIELVEALMEGRLGGAALDVFEDEPRVPAELLDLENVVLLPHLGSATLETRQAMRELTLANLESFTKCGTLLTPVPSTP